MKDVALVDVLGDELLADLRRECRYHNGVPMTQVVRDSVKDWVVTNRNRRELNRRQVNELRQAEVVWADYEL